MQSVRPFAVALSALGLALLSCASSTPDGEEAVAQAAQALTQIESVLGFEGLSSGQWTTTGATLALSNDRTEGQHALKVTSTASSFTLTSAKFTSPATVTDRLWVDLFIPSNSAGWYGGMNIYVQKDCGVGCANGFGTAWLGNISFDYYPKGKWVRAAVSLSSSSQWKLAQGTNDLSISFQGSVPVGATAYLDRIYFGQNTSIPLVPTEAKVQFDLPAGLSMGDAALEAAGTLRVNDRALVKTPSGAYAPIANSGSTETILGTDAQTGTIYSVANVTLRSRATVNGSALTTGKVLPQDSTSKVAGLTAEGVDLNPFNRVTWDVSIPADAQPGFALQPGDKRSTAVPPGRYSNVDLKNDTKLTLGSGTYFFDQLVLNSGSQLDIVNTASSTTIIYVLDTVTLQGRITTQFDVGNVLLVALGKMPFAIESDLPISVIAAESDVALSAGKTLLGSLVAKNVEVHQDSRTSFRPFKRNDCSTIAATCTVVPGCPNPDADNDGLSDCSEKTDGDFWTDPNIFNGAKTSLYAPCHPSGPSNSLIDTPAKIQACVSGTVLATANQHSGWNWGQQATPSNCEVGLGFSTPWTTCRNDWQLYSEAYIRVEQSSRHCFALKGDTTGVAAALLIDGDGPVATIGGGAGCVQLTAGIHKLNWLYERVGTTKQSFGIFHCQANTEDCVPTTPLSQRALRPAYTEGSPVCDTPSQDCSELCRCSSGNGTCSSDSQCQSGAICGQDNGSQFGKAPMADVCWPASCATLEWSPSACSRIPRQCESTSDCGLAEVCGENNGAQFDNLFAHVCWPSQCETEPAIAGCGTLQSPCGRCSCIPNCSSKLCGDAPDDGCGGTCKGYCGDGSLGCKQHLECKAGSVCDTTAGKYFGGEATDSVCWPQSCSTTSPESRDCGQPTSVCGSVCPTCTPQCGGRECGLDPLCGKSCGTCASGQFCSSSGKCESSSVDPLILERVKRVYPPTEAGTLDGTFSVTPAGQAHYSIPLVVPPGVANLAPELSLEYDSSWGTSEWGLGWRLSGLSTISRCPRKYAQGGVKPVTYDDSDQFCFDGVPLVLVGESSGRRWYRTEIDSFAKISSYGESLTPVDSEYGQAIVVGPTQFEVEFPSGRVATYAATSRMVATKVVPPYVAPVSPGAYTNWSISRIADSVGNIIDFEYESTKVCKYGGRQEVPGVAGEAAPQLFCSKTQRLKSINYGGSLPATLGHNRAVTFEYEDLHTDSLKPLIRQTWNGGVPHELDHRCTKISTSFEGTEVRSYRLGFEKDLRWSRLEAMQECYGEKCKPATTFAYNPNTGFSMFARPATSLGSNGGRRYSLRTVQSRLDLNGDGREDLLLNPNLDQRNALKCDHDWAIAIATGDQYHPYQVRYVQLPFENCSDPKVGDLDSDGNWEILFNGSSYAYAGDGNFTQRPYPAELKGPFYDDNGDGLPITAVDFGVRPDRVALLDTDSDGVLNAVRTSGGRMSSSGRDLGVSLLAVPLDKIESDALVRRVKASAPQCHMICEYGDARCFDYWYKHNWDPDKQFCQEFLEYNAADWVGGLKTLDFNGDGLTDFIEWHPGLGGTLDSGGTTELDIRAFTNTGRNQFVLAGAPIKASKWPTTAQLTAKSFRQSFVYDTDHDGRDELIVVGPYGYLMRVPVRPDLSRLDPGTTASVLGEIGRIGEFDQFIVSDVDGNGTPDVLYGDDAVRVLYQNKEWSDRLITVTNGIGRIDKVAYKSGKNAPYSVGTGAPDNLNSRTIRNIPSVVTKHEVHSREGIVAYTERYEYQNARLGLYGRGGLGFQQIKRTLEYADSPPVFDYTQYDVSTFMVVAGDASTIGGPVRDLFPFAGRPTRHTREIHDVTSGIGGAVENVTVIQTETTHFAVGYSDLRRPFIYLKSEEAVVQEHPRGVAPRQISRRTKEHAVNDYGATTGTIETTYGAGGDVVETIASRFWHDFLGTDLTAIWPRRITTRAHVTSTRGGESVTRKTKMEYYPNGSLKYEEENSGKAEQFKHVEYTRNNRGNVESTTTTTGSSSSTSRAIHDLRGEFAETEINALGHQATNVWYKGHGILAAHQDPNGLVTQTFIDGFGRTVLTVDPQGEESATAYLSTVPNLDFLGDRVRFVERHTQTGRPTSFEYFDSLGRSIGTETITQKGSLRTAQGYDDKGRLSWSTQRPFTAGTIPAGLLAYTYYDNLDRPILKRLLNDASPSGFSAIEFQYGRPDHWPTDDVGSETLAEASAVIHRTYPGVLEETELLDVNGKRLALLDRAWATTTMRYGPFGVVREVHDAAGLTYGTSYDELGRIVATTDPIRGNSSTIYSSGIGEVVTVTTNAGASIRRHDALGRVTSETNPEGTTTWTYDTGTAALGQLASIAGPASELSPGGTAIAHTYASRGSLAGARGKLQSTTHTIAGESFKVEYDYDGRGRPSKLTFPSVAGRPFAVYYNYDADGNLLNVQDVNNPSQPKYYQVLSRTSLNEIESERLNAGLVTSYEYYPLNGSAKSYTHKLNDVELARTTLSYYETGSLRVAGHFEDGALTDSSRYYEYDFADRFRASYQAILSGGVWSKGGVVEESNYDSIGNLKFKSGLGSYAYGLPNNPYAVTSTSSTSYHYDNLGRQTWRSGADVPGGSQTIDYASYGHPTKVTAGTTDVTRYAYNGLRDLVLRQDSAETTLYVGDIYRRTVEASDPTKFSHTYSIRANGQTVVEMTLIEQNHAVVSQPEVRALRQDYLGTGVFSVWTVGSHSHAHYDTYGKTQDPLLSRTGTGYAGYGNEAGIGLLRMGVRLYDPALGRVLSPDGLPKTSLGQDGLNPYAYVYNRPLQFTDRSGFEGDPWSPTWLSSYYNTVYQYTYNAPVITMPSWSTTYANYVGAAGVVPGPEGDPFRLGTLYPQSQYMREWSNFRDSLNDFALQNPVPLINQLLNGGPGPINGNAYPLISNALNLDTFVLMGGADYSTARELLAASNLANLVMVGLGQLQLSKALAAAAATMSRIEAAVGGIGAVEETLTLYHGSVANYSSILRNGLDAAKAPTWVTTDLTAARNAIGSGRVLSPGQGLDMGIVQSSVPKSAFEALQSSGGISGFRTWPGFGGGSEFGEFVLRHPDAIHLFNAGIRF